MPTAARGVRDGRAQARGDSRKPDSIGPAVAVSTDGQGRVTKIDDGAVTTALSYGNRLTLRSDGVAFTPGTGALGGTWTGIAGTKATAATVSFPPLPTSEAAVVRAWVGIDGDTPISRRCWARRPSRRG